MKQRGIAQTTQTMSVAQAVASKPIAVSWHTMPNSVAIWRERAKRGIVSSVGANSTYGVAVGIAGVHSEGAGGQGQEKAETDLW